MWSNLTQEETGNLNYHVLLNKSNQSYSKEGKVFIYNFIVNIKEFLYALMQKLVIKINMGAAELALRSMSACCETKRAWVQTPCIQHENQAELHVPVTQVERRTQEDPDS